MLLCKLIAVLTLILAAAIINIFLKARKSPLSKLPGPWYSKYTNTILRYHGFAGRRIFYVHKLHQQYGGVVRIAPNEVAIADVSSVSQIHKVGSGFLKSAFYTDLVPNAKPGIFAMRDPHDHAMRRRLFARAFSHNSLRDNWEAEIRSKVELAVQKIKHDAMGTQKGADVLEWWTLMATDIIAHLNFGDSFNMLETGKQSTYVLALQDVLITGVIRAEAPLAHALLQFVPSEFARRLMRAEKVVYEYGARAITNMRGRDGNVMNLFGQMLAACDSEEKVFISDDDIRNEAGNLIIAGSDTTGTTLTYLVWAVLRQPELQVLLENEVAQLTEKLSLVELEAAPILNSVLNETLRLYGAAPGALPRIVPGRGLTVGEHQIPAGVEVSTQAYTNHRDPVVFPDPLRFDGFRFIDKTSWSAEQKAAYMPFGGGSRVCIGIHLAWIELRLATALFFRNCRGARLSEVMTDEMMEMDNRFLIAPRGHCCYVKL